MPRIGVSKQEVFEVAHKLHLERRNVTVAAVREEVGRGSLTTIHKHLKAWHNQSPGYDVEEDRSSPTIPYIYIESLKDKIIVLEKAVSELENKNSTLEREVLDKESVIANNDVNLSNLKQMYEQSAFELDSYKNKYSNELEKVKLLSDSHKLHIDKIVSNYESRTRELMSELKEVLISSRDEVRDMSSKHTDTIMDLKAKIIILEDTINNKDKLIEKLKVGYNSASLLEKLSKLEEDNINLEALIDRDRDKV